MQQDPSRQARLTCRKEVSLKRGKYRPRHGSYTEAEIAELWVRRAAGETGTRIARHMGLDATALRDYFHKPVAFDLGHGRDRALRSAWRTERKSRAAWLRRTRCARLQFALPDRHRDRKSTRLNSSHPSISYAVFCLKKKKKNN